MIQSTREKSEPRFAGETIALKLHDTDGRGQHRHLADCACLQAPSANVNYVPKRASLANEDGGEGGI